MVFDTVISSYDMTFDNSAFTEATEALLKSREGSLPIRAGILFEMFPFCILFQVRETCLFQPGSLLFGPTKKSRMPVLTFF